MLDSRPRVHKRHVAGRRLVSGYCLSRRRLAIDLSDPDIARGWALLVINPVGRQELGVDLCHGLGDRAAAVFGFRRNPSA